MKSFLVAFIIICQIYNIHIYAQDTLMIKNSTPSLYRIDISPYMMSTNSQIKIGENGNLAGKVMSQQFSSIVSGQSSTTIGNFASVTPTDGKIDFAGSLIIKNRSVLTAKASGKATDGLLGIFETLD